jgi:hypothetical protein
MNRRCALGFPVAVVLLILVVGGCSSVTLVQPLPQSPDAAERGRFEGEWIAEDQVLYVRFGSGGIGQFAGVDWKEDRFQLERGEFILSRGRTHHFLTLRVQEKGAWEDRYYFVQYHFTAQGDLVLWLPDVGAFREAVAQGKLAGVGETGRESGSVTIASPPETVLAFLNDPANGPLFDYRDPMIVKRLILKPAGAREKRASDNTAPGTVSPIARR